MFVLAMAASWVAEFQVGLKYCLYVPVGMSVVLATGTSSARGVAASTIVMSELVRLPSLPGVRPSEPGRANSVYLTPLGFWSTTCKSPIEVCEKLWITIDRTLSASAGTPGAASGTHVRSDVCGTIGPNQLIFWVVPPLPDEGTGNGPVALPTVYCAGAHRASAAV